MQAVELLNRIASRLFLEVIDHARDADMRAYFDGGLTFIEDHLEAITKTQ